MGYVPSYDCSLRTCPFGYAWGGLPEPNSTNTVGNGNSGNTGKARQKAECSDMGTCDRAEGLCVCLPGFRGAACETSMCPGKGDCSGHGQCLPMNVIAQMSNALPLSKPQNTTASSSSSAYEVPAADTTSSWDQHRIMGCVCDSSWPVGLGGGESQEPEWFGPDCSLKRCPSGDNPDTAANELDCSGKLAAGGKAYGNAGNICHHDCSGKGNCDYKSGTCACFLGHTGIACEIRDTRAV